MAFVRQRGKKDCGVAALAMLCDVTYEEADRAIPWRRHGCAFGTDTKMLRAAAKSLGYEGQGTPKHQLRRINRKPESVVADMWRDIPYNSLVKIPHPDPNISIWHWVVWRNDRIYDPARGVFRPRNYGNHYPTSYMQFIKED